MPVAPKCISGPPSPVNTCNNNILFFVYYSSHWPPGKLFSQSCVPGALDQKYDPLQENPDRLCSICAGTGEDRCRRSQQEPYYGYAGAFRWIHFYLARNDTLFYACIQMSGLPRSMPNADRCQSMPIKIMALIRNVSQCWSLPINSSQCWSIPLNADQCRISKTLVKTVNKCWINFAWSGIDRRWSALRGVDRNWSALRGI